MTFFEWLELVGELNRYEALLDASEEFHNQNLWLDAHNEIDKLKVRYEQEDFRRFKLKRIIKRINENKMYISRFY